MLTPKIISCSAIKVITTDDEQVLIAVPDKINLIELKTALDKYYPKYKKVFLENTVGILNLYNE